MADFSLDSEAPSCQGAQMIKLLCAVLCIAAIPASVLGTQNAKGELENKRYIFLDSHGRMGIFTIKQGAGDELTLDVKITP
jgi:hypothetical protein